MAFSHEDKVDTLIRAAMPAPDNINRMWDSQELDIGGPRFDAIARGAAMSSTERATLARRYAIPLDTVAS